MDIESTGAESSEPVAQGSPPRAKRKASGHWETAYHAPKSVKLADTPELQTVCTVPMINRYSDRLNYA